MLQLHLGLFSFFYLAPAMRAIEMMEQQKLLQIATVRWLVDVSPCWCLQDKPREYRKSLFATDFRVECSARVLVA